MGYLNHYESADTFGLSDQIVKISTNKFHVGDQFMVILDLHPDNTISVGLLYIVKSDVKEGTVLYVNKTISDFSILSNSYVPGLYKVSLYALPTGRLEISLMGKSVNEDDVQTYFIKSTDAILNSNYWYITANELQNKELDEDKNLAADVYLKYPNIPSGYLGIRLEMNLPLDIQLIENHTTNVRVPFNYSLFYKNQNYGKNPGSIISEYANISDSIKNNQLTGIMRKKSSAIASSYNNTNFEDLLKNASKVNTEDKYIKKYLMIVPGFEYILKGPITIDKIELTAYKKSDPNTIYPIYYCSPDLKGKGAYDTLVYTKINYDDFDSHLRVLNAVSDPASEMCYSEILTRKKTPDLNNPDAYYYDFIVDDPSSLNFDIKNIKHYITAYPIKHQYDISSTDRVPSRNNDSEEHYGLGFIYTQNLTDIFILEYKCYTKDTDESGNYHLIYTGYCECSPIAGNIMELGFPDAEDLNWVQLYFDKVPESGEETFLILADESRCIPFKTITNSEGNNDYFWPNYHKYTEGGYTYNVGKYSIDSQSDHIYLDSFTHYLYPTLSAKWGWAKKELRAGGLILKTVMPKTHIVPLHYTESNPNVRDEFIGLWKRQLTVFNGFTNNVGNHIFNENLLRQMGCYRTNINVIKFPLMFKYGRCTTVCAELYDGEYKHHDDVVEPYFKAYTTDEDWVANGLYSKGSCCWSRDVDINLSDMGEPDRQFGGHTDRACVGYLKRNDKNAGGYLSSGGFFYYNEDGYNTNSHLAIWRYGSQTESDGYTYNYDFINNHGTAKESYPWFLHNLIRHNPGTAIARIYNQKANNKTGNCVDDWNKSTFYYTPVNYQYNLKYLYTSGYSVSIHNVSDENNIGYVILRTKAHGLHTYDEPWRDWSKNNKEISIRHSTYIDYGNSSGATLLESSDDWIKEKVYLIYNPESYLYHSGCVRENIKLDNVPVDGNKVQFTTYHDINYDITNCETGCANEALRFAGYVVAANLVLNANDNYLARPFESDYTVAAEIPLISSKDDGSSPVGILQKSIPSLLNIENYENNLLPFNEASILKNTIRYLALYSKINPAIRQSFEFDRTFWHSGSFTNKVNLSTTTEIGPDVNYVININMCDPMNDKIADKYIITLYTSDGKTIDIPSISNSSLCVFKATQSLKIDGFSIKFNNSYSPYISTIGMYQLKSGSTSTDLKQIEYMLTDAATQHPDWPIVYNNDISAQLDDCISLPGIYCYSELGIGCYNLIYNYAHIPDKPYYRCTCYYTVNPETNCYKAIKNSNLYYHADYEYTNQIRSNYN